MARVAESHEYRKVAAAGTWLIDLTNVVDDLTGADAGSILRPAVPGPEVEAIPTQHANTASVGRMLYGATAKLLMARTAGWFFAIDPTNDCWYGGPYEMATDQITIPRGDLVARNVVFSQGAGAWYDGGPALTAATELDRVTTIDLAATTDLPDGLRWDPPNDRAILLLTRSAEATFRLKSGAAQTAERALATTTRMLDLGALTALGNARITNGTFTITGLTGTEKLEGWLLVGKRQTID